MDDIQSWWEVPSIAHFCSLFRAAFNLLDFDIEELEEALLTDGAEDAGSSLLQELIVRLLCGCLGNHDISTFNYQMFLRRLFRQKCQEYGRENPFNTDMDFQFLPLRAKVEILHALCDFRLDAEDVQDLLKNLESDSLRVEPLGHDENFSAYWYFYGTRLYREDFPKAKKKVREKRSRKKRSRVSDESEPEDMGPGEWQVVCFTEQDWDKLTESFRDSTSKTERSLFHTLAEDFLPEIPRLFAEKERLQRKRLMEFRPRRQSSRVEKLKQQKREKEKEEEKLMDLEKQKQEEKRSRLHSQRDRDTRPGLRSRSCTNSECGSLGSVGESLAEQGTFVGRQTNNSLASATGQIVIQGLRRKLRTSQVFKQTAEDLQTGLYKILEHIKNQEDSWPFVDPVDEAYAPRYYSIISKPMDLSHMEDKLDQGHYQTLTDFRSDFQLIIDNCRQYNGTDNEYTEMVGKLQEAFQQAVDRYLESDPSSDEEVAVEFAKTPEDSKVAVVQNPRKKKKKEELQPLPKTPSPRREMSEDSNQSSTTEVKHDTEESSTEPRVAHSHNGAKRNKKAGVMKNAAAIEALELATEQTLKDINKWLDDTPRFSEFSSASNSPSHFISAEEYEVAGSRIEGEYRRKLERPKPSREMKEGVKRRPTKDQVKQRRREIQRTIERLQPGKSKGNLISNMQGASKGAEESKDKANSLLVGTAEMAPKLSLGSVLASDALRLGGGTHNFDAEMKEEEKPAVQAPATPPDPVPNTRRDTSPVKEKPVEVVEEQKKPAVKEPRQEKATPNLSAWFKAFGAPKPAPVVKKKTECVAQEPELPRVEEKKLGNVARNSSPSHAPVDPPSGRTSSLQDEGLSPHAGPRQRKASTGSSMSERSSFSQDLLDPLEGSSPRLDERLYPPYPSPRAEEPAKQYPPLNGTIRVGFYQDTSSAQKNSPDKNSNSNSPSSAYYATRTYPPPHDPGGFSPYSQDAGGVQFYDTSKPLTDQYRAARTQEDYTPSVVYSQPQKPPAMFPVKKRVYSEVEANPQPSTTSDKPVLDLGLPQASETPTTSPDVVFHRGPFSPVPNLNNLSHMVERYPSGPSYYADKFGQPVSTLQSAVVPGVGLFSQASISYRGYSRPELQVPTTSSFSSVQPYNCPPTDLSLLASKTTPPLYPHAGQDLLSKGPSNYPGKTTSPLYSHPGQELLLSSKGPSNYPSKTTSPLYSHPSQELLSNKGPPNYTSKTTPSMYTHPGQDLLTTKASNYPSSQTSPPLYSHAGQEMLSTKVPPNYPSKTSSALYHPSPELLTSKGMTNYPSKSTTPLYTHSASDLIPTKASVPLYQHPGPELLTSKSIANYPSKSTGPLYHPGPELLGAKGPPLYPSVPSETVARVPRKRKTKQASAETGFQQYVGSSKVEPTAISLKTASVVPGSAFNFGPAPPSLGLYGDKDSYPAFLEEYRTPPAGYYLGSDPVRDKAPPPSSSFPFLSHPQPRPPSYPFINPHQASLIDGASSPLYQQYLQRHQEEMLRHSGAPMVLHQGLLSPPTGYPPGYHPALSIRQPYDALNRPSWL